MLPFCPTSKVSGGLPAALEDSAQPKRKGVKAMGDHSKEGGVDSFRDGLGSAVDVAQGGAAHGDNKADVYIGADNGDDRAHCHVWVDKDGDTGVKHRGHCDDCSGDAGSDK